MNPGFAKSLFTVSSLTIVSRIGGFIRDSLTAVFLGAGPVADAFFVAQRLPNLFRSLFAEGAFSAAFVPLYTSEQERHGDEAAQEFAGQALMLLLAALVPFSVLVMMFMPYVMRALAPGFEDEPEKFRLAVDFSTITFPYLALISVTALQTGVLNARGRFGPGAAAPIAFNIVLILGLFAAHLFEWHVGYTLAWAVTISGVVQCLWLAVSCARARASIPLLKPSLGEASAKLFRRIGPGAVGAGAAQINLLISTILASTLPTGAVSYLFYADRLNQLPLGVVGIAVATTLLPLLSRYVEQGDDDKIRHYNTRAIEFCFLLGLPAMIGLIVAAKPIIETLFQHGAFKAEDTAATVEALQAYALGIPGFLLVKVFAADFFARHDTKTPVKAAVVSMGVNVLLSAALLLPLQHIGIALANSIAVNLNAGLHYHHLKKRNFPIGTADLPKSMLKILLSAAVMAGVCWALVKGWDAMAFANLMQKVSALGVLIGISGLVYAVALHTTGAVRIQDVKDILNRKSA
ncbi:MAG: murein biosynthesis integral membrane protein MurJ [Alphaproteobacteria bacterium]|nr:murein biosynthesis integral membrane protein MurJ [Alphaproteobacteria bacterium]